MSRAGAGAPGARSAFAALRPRRRPRRAAIVALHDATSLGGDGAVRSVQAADLAIEDGALAQIWNAEHLERLARTYWRFLTRVTLGLIQVRYTPGERFVVLLLRPLKLLTFLAPEYELDGARGVVRWRIARGLLVARGREGRGHLQIEVRRGAQAGAGHTALHVEIEVANFYPAIASGLSRRVYELTQSRLHVIITCAFLRSLTRLDLARSRVGTFAAP